MTHWHNIKAQMMAYRRADSVAREAKCKLAEPDELCVIWERICLAEYISLDSTHVEVQPPSAITGEVVDTYDKHPFCNHFLDNKAKETTNTNLCHEVASATTASHHEEQASATTSASTSQQHCRLEALVKTSLVRFFPQLPNAVFTTYTNIPNCCASPAYFSRQDCDRYYSNYAIPYALPLFWKVTFVLTFSSFISSGQAGHDL